MTTDRICHGWECDGDCGCGVCCPPGQTPDPPYHVVSDGEGGEVVCGRFVFDGLCQACLSEVPRG